MAPLAVNAPIGVYIHVPFCAHICPYCDFNTYAGQTELIPAYVDAVRRDIELSARLTGRRAVSSIFFGGGTPTLLAASQIEALYQCILDWYDAAADAEVTVEANPNGLTADYLSGLRGAGVNRLSIGLQTTDRRGLRRLGRLHEAADAESAVRAAVAAGFQRISLDLIFGWPGQELESLAADIDRVLSWADGAVDHLSLYSLIVEPGTPMADAVQRGIITVPNEDETADLYELAMERLAEAGWEHYEVSNWSRWSDGGSAHNILYWRNGEYLGLGAGAHGRIGTTRTMRHLLPATYIGSVDAGDPVSNADEIDEATARGETMMLGLRLLREGVTHAEFEARHGVRLLDHFGEVIARHNAIGLLELDDRGVRLTRRGLLLANDVCADYLP
ncbi:MAG: radical SAM family heme chaperone HemW [Chloroflexota bacterium]|nr:radical SAM family heme chaperone HemW [Chloroflexota bacterium]